MLKNFVAVSAVLIIIHVVTLRYSCFPVNKVEENKSEVVLRRGGGVGDGGTRRNKINTTFKYFPPFISSTYENCVCICTLYTYVGAVYLSLLPRGRRMDRAVL